jgi:ABC-type dipeptide/oligopeptide/nickel transport system permease subunit
MYLLARNKLSLAALIVLVLLVLGAIFANVLIPYPQDIADASHIEIKLQPPSAEHWMGTDELGRDIFSRVVYGARVSLRSALGAVGLSLLIGDALLVGGGAFYYFKTYKGGKSKAPKQSVSDDDEDDETKIEDPNDDEKSETDDTVE